MYLRVTLALILAVVLSATHWKAYVMGQGAVRVELQVQALKDSEAARQREHALTAQVETLDHELQKQKARNAALTRAHAERLRQYEAALGGAGADTTAAGGTVGPFADIARECGRALVALDAHARELESTATALQNYAAGVCVTVPERALKGSE